MEENIFIIKMFSYILANVTLLICHLLPKRWMWLGAVCGFFAGFIFTFDDRWGLAHGIFLSGFLGLAFALIMVQSGLVTKHYAEKGWKEIESKLSKKK